MRIFYPIVILLCVHILLVSCTRTHIIEEKPAPEGGAQSKAEKDPLDKLKAYKDDAENKVQAIVGLNQSYESDRKKIKGIYQNIEGLDFLNPGFLVTVAESKEYSDFKVQTKDLDDKIAAADIKDKTREIEDIVDASGSENNKLNDSLIARNIFDQIKTSDSLAKNAKKDIENIKTALEADENFLKNKIDGAAKDFNAIYGEQRSKALDDLILKLQDANSIKDIETILNDSRFFVLKTELSQVPIYGPMFTELLDTKLPQELNRIIVEAQNQKRIIDNFFNNLITPDPVTQAELDTFARNLDSIFGNDELKQYANTKGIVRVEINRQNELRKELENPIHKMAGPGNVFKSINDLITQFAKSVTIAKRSDVFTGVLSPFKTLNVFYDPGRSTEIKNATVAAAQPGYAAYQLNSANLKKALEPYTLAGIEDSLIRGGFLNKKYDEMEFGRNFIKILARMFDEEYFKILNNNKNAIIKQRLDFLLNQLASHPTIAFIKIEINNLKKAKSEAELLIACPPIAVNLALYFQKNLNCAELIKDTKALKNAAIAAGKDKDPTWEKNIVTIAIDRANENYLKGIDEIERAKGLVDQPIFFVDGRELKFKGKSGLYDVTPQVPLGESFFRERVASFNEKVLNQGNPMHFIDLNDAMLFPNTNAYDRDTLIADVLRSLSVINIGTAKMPVYYSVVIKEYQDLVNLAIPGPQMVTLKDRFKAASKDPLKEKLFSTTPGVRHFLSATGFTELVSLLAGVSVAEKLKNQKEIALGHLVDGLGAAVGFADFKDAILDVFNTTTDIGSAAALNILADFFNPAIQLSIQNIALMPAIDYSATFGIAGQLGVIKTLISKKPSYKALDALATITDPKTILFKSQAGATNIGRSLEERAGPEKNPKRQDAVPASLSNAIFGPMLSQTLFSDLKLNLEESLKALKASIPVAPVVKTEDTLRPIINAFTFIFDYPLSELNKLLFDGTDDTKIKEFYNLIDDRYVEKFEGFKSAVGEREVGKVAPDPLRPIIQTLNDLQGKLQVAVITGPAMAPIIADLKDWVAKLLL